MPETINTQEQTDDIVNEPPDRLWKRVVLCTGLILFVLTLTSWFFYHSWRVIVSLALGTLVHLGNLAWLMRMGRSLVQSKPSPFAGIFYVFKLILFFLVVAILLRSSGLSSGGVVVGLLVPIPAIIIGGLFGSSRSPLYTK